MSPTLHRRLIPQIDNGSRQNTAVPSDLELQTMYTDYVYRCYTTEHLLVNPGKLEKPLYTIDLMLIFLGK